MFSSLRTLVRNIYASTRRACQSIFSLTPKEQDTVLKVIALLALGYLVRTFHWWGIGKQ